MYRAALTILLLTTITGLRAQSTLREYSDKVVEYSIALERSELSSEARGEELQRARTEHLPEITFDRSATFDFGRNIEGRRWSWASSLALRQVIYGGGGITAQRREAELALSISLANEELTLRSVRLEAERRFWALSHAAEYKESIRQYVEIIESLRRVIERRYVEGYSSKGDLLQIESRLLDAEYQLSQAEEAYTTTLHSYNSLCGNEVDAPATLLESILGLQPLPQRCNLEELLATHPEHLIAEFEAAKARWAVRSTSAGYMPSIELRISGDLSPTLPHTASSSLKLQGGAILDFHTPIFHFGERRRAVHAAKSEQISYELIIEDVADQLTLREENSWTNVIRRRERLESIARSLYIARENLDISTYAYNEGQTTILDVMQAQISWLQIYRNMLAAHYDYSIAVAEYRWLVGG